MYTDGTATRDRFDWRDDAACLGADPEGWFPVGESAEAMAQTRDAIAICDGCPVEDACLKWALDTCQEAGVWGGKSERERKAMKRRDRRSRREPTDHGKPREPRSDRHVPAGPTMLLLTAALRTETARDLAERLGIGFSTVWQIVSGGQATVTVRTEQAVKAALGVGVDA
jgi:WhiB family transcriptional regulator, redox-sensing transcriptional regulator